MSGIPVGVDAAGAPGPSRRTLFLLVGPIVAITAMGLLATAFTPALATHHPLLLITLDARNRFLVLARHVDLVPFVVVAVLRRSFSDPLFYLLGRIYGNGALRWLEKKGGGGQLVVLTEKLFTRAAYPMVFLFPGSIVCALAGETGMAPVGFVTANLAGTLTSVLLVRRFSSTIASPVESLLSFFNHHLVATTSVSVGLVVLSLVLSRVQGRLDAHLEELEGAAPPSDVEQGVETDGDAGVVGDGLDGQDDTGHE